jgi:hypothetical protein
MKVVEAKIGFDIEEWMWRFLKKDTQGTSNRYGVNNILWQIIGAHTAQKGTYTYVERLKKESSLDKQTKCDVDKINSRFGIRKCRPNAANGWGRVIWRKSLKWIKVCVYMMHTKEEET